VLPAIHDSITAALALDQQAQILVLTRFLDANRFPLRSKTLYRS
jgi:hypothetical protein